MSHSFQGALTAATLDGEAFMLWKNILEQRMGLAIDEKRKQFLELCLAKRTNALSLSNLEEYYQYLHGTNVAQQMVEWSALINHLTVQETTFFRHANSFELVRQELKKFYANSHASWQAWSVGCSTGEEAYSLAMLAQDVGSQFGKVGHFGVVGTDISGQAINTARAGVYSLKALSKMSDKRKQKYLVEHSREQHVFSEQLKKRVCFATHNILNYPAMPAGKMDLIFCQNMFIYFKRWRRHEVVQKLAEKLNPNGVLILGLGELTSWRLPGLERIDFADTLAFRRVDKGE